CFEMGLVKACRVQPLVGVPELLAQARGMLSRAAGSSSTLAPRGPGRDERTSAHTTPASLAAGATPMRGRERSAPDRPPANDGDEGEEAEPGPGIQSAAGEPRLEILGTSVATPSSEAPNPIPPPYPSQSPRKPDPSLTGDIPGGRNASETGDSSLSLQTSEDMEPAGEDVRQTPLFLEEPSSELAPVAAAPDGGLSVASGASTPGEGSAPWPEAAPPERVAEFLEEPAEALESPQGVPTPGAGPILDPRGAAPPQADPQPGTQTPPGTGRASKSHSPGSRPSSPVGAGGASPEGSPFMAADFELLREAAPCDDPRWREFVERASAQNRRAAAQLRRMDVLALHADAVELALPDPTATLSPQNLEELQPLLHQVFGAAFQLRINNGKTGKTRPAFTIAGRNRLAEEARRAARRKDAEEDPLVKSLQRVFPKSRVVEVRLKETNPPDRSEDVQGKSG
ncbi:MAG: hypothetical protein OEW39_08295, partial [Deltaproteobacteria bacterium]|nr:hypothetical protein [Deltaproteobacteria bacterium]